MKRQGRGPRDWWLGRGCDSCLFLYDAAPLELEGRLALGRVGGGAGGKRWWRKSPRVGPRQEEKAPPRGGRRRCQKSRHELRPSASGSARPALCDPVDYTVHGILCDPVDYTVHGFSRPELWSGWPFPSPGNLPDPGIEPRSPALQADSLPAEPPGKPKNTGVGNLSLLFLNQGIFLTQELNWGLLHCRRILHQLSYQGSIHTPLCSRQINDKDVLWSTGN